LKTDKGKNGLKRIYFYLILIIFFLATSTSAADVKRVALIPFKINAKEDLTYLRDGINDMLTTRLSQNERITVIQRSEVEQAVGAAALSGAITEAEARGIGSKLGAAFVMTGSLTVLNENVSIDAKMIDIAGHRPTMAFFEQADSLGEVITKINTMASQINAGLSGQAAVATAAPAQRQPEQPTSREQEARELDRHAHPEKLLKQGRPDAEGGSPFIMSNEASSLGGGYWKSPTFKHPLHGLAIGDVNGDGLIETVLISDHAVIIYGNRDGRFFKIADIPENKSINLISVDVADINENGTPEIFATALNAQRNGLNSYVLEFDGANYARIVENASWYFRVVRTPARGEVLLGQRHRRKDAFAGAVEEMEWRGGDYVPRDPVRAPKPINVIGLALGDISGNREEYIVSFRDNDRLQIIDGSGQRVWTSSEKLGGGNLYYVIPKTDQGEVETRRYYPVPIRVHHIPGQPELEIMVPRNFEVAGKKLEQFRLFTGGQIESYVWDGMGLANKWHTRKLSGYIRDFAVGDFDNDGAQELIIALIQISGEVILTQARSNLVAYEMVLRDEAAKAE
jgi:TolB-like protein